MEGFNWEQKVADSIWKSTRLKQFLDFMALPQQKKELAKLSYSGEPIYRLLYKIAPSDNQSIRALLKLGFQAVVY